MTFDEKLARAFEETSAERSERLMKIEKKHRFSLAYKLWERKTLRDLRRGRRDERWTLKKAKYAVAAMTAALSLLIGGTAYAAVAMIGRYGFENKIDYSKVLIESHPSDKTEIEEYYGLPEEDGWTKNVLSKDNYGAVTCYTRGKYSIAFTQSIIQEGSAGNISTDRAKVEMVSLYEENDGFVLEFDDATLIYWIYDGYLFDMVGNIDKNEAINLAYSAKIVEL